MQTNGTHTSLSGGTLRGIACGAGAGALWGLVFLAPELVRTFPPITLTAGRYLAYGLIAACLIGPRLSTLLPKLRRREWFGLAWLSLAGNTLYYILLSNAVQTGGIAMTSLVIGFLPVAVTIIGSRDHGAVPMRRLAASLLFCIAGAVCIGWQAIAQPNAGAAQNQIVGLACAVGALASWTAYAVGNSRWLGRLSDVSAHDWSLLTGLATGAQAILLVPVAVALDRSHHSALEWAQLSGVSIAVAVLASIAGNALWNQMSRLLPLTLVGQMILFETLFALIYGFMWEQRLPTLLEFLAFILVVLSVLTCIAAHAGAEQAPTDEQRRLLGVSATEPVRYRRVRLICGDHVLSEADNWYLPARLTPEMNRLLITTDIAFGRAVQRLNFRRRTLSVKLLWPPMPQDWEMGAPLPERRGSTLTIPHAVLEHRAVLSLPDGIPFSEVVETYTREVLAFPEPQRPQHIRRQRQ